MPEFTSSACPEYEFVAADAKAVDWDKAFQEVEEGEKAKNEKLQKEQQQKLKLDMKKSQTEMENKQAEFM